MHTDNLLQNMTHEELASLKYRIESIQKNRQTRLTEIIKNKDNKSLLKYINEIPLSPKDISTYHLSQPYAIEDIDFIKTLFNSLKNNDNVEIKNTVLMKYEIDSYSELSFNGLFFQAFKNVENYKKIKESFPTEFYQFLDDIFNKKNTILNRCKDDLFINLSIDIFQELIEDKLLTLNEKTIKYIIAYNNNILNHIKHNNKDCITDEIKKSMILKNYEEVEKYYNDVFFKHLFNDELANKLFLINYQYQNTTELVFLENNFNINKDIIFNDFQKNIDQTTITYLCKGSASFFNYILNNISINNENINNFIKPIIKYFKKSSTRSVDISTYFFDTIKDNEQLLYIFKRKMFSAKNSNPEFFEHFEVALKALQLDKMLDKKVSTNFSRKI